MTTHIQIGRLCDIYADRIVLLTCAPIGKQDSKGRSFNSGTTEYDGPMVVHAHFTLQGTPGVASIGVANWLVAQSVLQFLRQVATELTPVDSTHSHNLSVAPDGI